MEIADITKKRVVEYLGKGRRFDDRELLKHRKIDIEFGISNQAEGSARVRIGKTEVLAGVKLDVMEPFKDSPDEGVLMVAAELSPLASENFELGPPSIKAIELARIIDRGIRESEFIDFKKLCIKKGEKVWAVMIDIYPINDAGNLIDASCLAAVSALSKSFMPKLKEDKVEYGNLTDKKVPLNDTMPLTITFYRIGKTLIIDPVTEEEEAANARLSIAISSLKGKPIINALQKGEEGLLSSEEAANIIDSAIDIWKKYSEEISKKIK